MEFLTQHISSIGTVLLGLWFLYEKYVSGSTSLSTKIIGDYKTRCEQLEEKIKNDNQTFEEDKNKQRSVFDTFKKEMELIVSNYKVEITKLQSSNAEKDKHNQTLKDLLLDKNPEVVTVLKDIRAFLESSDKSSKQVLDYQTLILEEIKERGKKIDAASREHTGDPALVPTV